MSKWIAIALLAAGMIGAVAWGEGTARTASGFHTQHFGIDMPVLGEMLAAPDTRMAALLQRVDELERRIAELEACSCFNPDWPPAAKVIDNEAPGE